MNMLNEEQNAAHWESPNMIVSHPIAEFSLLKVVFSFGSPFLRLSCRSARRLAAYRPFSFKSVASKLHGSLQIVVAFSSLSDVCVNRSSDTTLRYSL